MKGNFIFIYCSKQYTSVTYNLIVYIISISVPFYIPKSYMLHIGIPTTLAKCCTLKVHAALEH